MITVAITGHRPNKLPCGWNVWTSDWSKYFVDVMKGMIIRIAEKHDGITVISGMALGIDQLWLVAGIKAKESGAKVKLIAAVPCKNQECLWKECDQRLYRTLLKRCDEVHLVHDGPCNSTCMQNRNKWMVDHSDGIIAIWDGTPGGTGNCVRYVKQVNKPLKIYPPASFKP